MATGKFEEWQKEEKLILLRGWAMSGLTDEQIAKNIGIRRETLYGWKNKYPEIRDALKKGKEVADYEVENALYKSAVGFTKTVRKPIKVKTEKQLKDKGKIVEEHIEYVEEEVYIPPSNTAQIFWLKNRKPADWRDKREAVIEETIEDDGLIAALMADDFELCDDIDMIIDDEEDEEAVNEDA